MTLKKDKASKTFLEAIKHILKQGPQKGWLLAYTSLCCPILEYVDTVWDQTLAKEIESMEILQHGLFDSLPDWEDGRVSWRRALNLVYRDEDITDYLF